LGVLTSAADGVLLENFQTKHRQHLKSKSPKIFKQNTVGS
jgi:hypothetical protein